MTAPADAEVLAALEELARAERDGLALPAVVNLGPFTAFTLLGAIQLACRHPRVSPRMRVVLRDLAGQLEPLFDPWPPLAEALRQGWDEARDVDGGP